MYRLLGSFLQPARFWRPSPAHPLPPCLIMQATETRVGTVEVPVVQQVC